MKNIHVLPTENSSRLSYNKDGVLELHRLQWRKNTQNIYITSDEEIKNGDFAYDSTSKTIVKFDFIKDRGDKVLIAGVHSINLDDNYTDLLSNFKKIILTTDQDLIKDDVQAIDDEFLEWFVKNPSCEEVEVLRYKNIGYRVYPPIILKEEPKQEPGKETADYIDRHIVEALVEVAKQKIYSEEEVIHIVQRLMYDVHCGGICEGDKLIDFKISPIQWFEKFKNK
jgi:hypothetical protein